MKGLFPYLMILLYLFSCKTPKTENDYILRISDMGNGESGYVTQAGDTIIPLGKYAVCFTDTFRTYAIVASPENGLICIDRNENVKYQVFLFDNGPDTVADGLFRIIQNGKIGYADSHTGTIIIEPRFACAWPFEDGVAKVSDSCEERSIGEYKEWTSREWFYIDKTGRRIKPAEAVPYPGE